MQRFFFFFSVRSPGLVIDPASPTPPTTPPPPRLSRICRASLHRRKRGMLMRLPPPPHSSPPRLTIKRCIEDWRGEKIPRAPLFQPGLGEPFKAPRSHLVGFLLTFRSAPALIRQIMSQCCYCAQQFIVSNLKDKKKKEEKGENNPTTYLVKLQ